jgi:hydrogenase maturation protein HypF
MRVFRGSPLPLRRSRGFAPEPLSLPWEWRRPVLATGAELKNTFCFGRGHHAFVSHHIGDLENYETLRSFTEGVDHFSRLFDVVPEVVAHDHHPDYLSTKHALEMHGVELTAVQHHHAHIASCMADNREAGPVIGVAFDGLGFGLDGTLWGGELLLADLVGFVRAGHLVAVPMPGGAAAIREPWRMAAAYLDAAYGSEVPAGLDIMRRQEARWESVVKVARAGVASPLTSSAGRLFDAVGALLGVRDSVNYEGQAAIELEQLADPAETAGYPLEVAAVGDTLELSGAALIRSVVGDLVAGVAPPTVPARFHNGLADGLVGCCRRLRDATGLSSVALSGGVFQNLRLLARTIDGLERDGFRVLVHSRVPPNDGGISLGQAVVAGARDGWRRA